MLRPRRPEDLPVLAEALLEQQPESRYPLRDPLPMPVEQFLHAHDAETAWTAELDGAPVGHACRTRPERATAEAAEKNRACARAHGCEIDALAWVSSLFVGLRGRGLGIGRLLLGAVVDDARGAGLHPCLEVLPVHANALNLYAATGWHEVLRLRPSWLRETVGDEGPDVRVMVLAAP